jgi:hypothetical protein
MLPLVAHCHLGLGTLYRGTGERKRAQEHVATAATMYRDMGMSFWLERAEAEMRELNASSATTSKATSRARAAPTRPRR